jgi:hypothetical protein
MCRIFAFTFVSAGMQAAQDKKKKKEADIALAKAFNMLHSWISSLLCPDARREAQGGCRQAQEGAQCCSLDDLIRILCFQPRQIMPNQVKPLEEIKKTRKVLWANLPGGVFKSLIVS